MLNVDILKIQRKKIFPNWVKTVKYRYELSIIWGSSKIIDPPTDPFWLVRLTENKKASWETR